jgi:DNA-binding CsgD family transcriptional regulator
MGISIKTVSTHKARMMAKMGVSTVSQLVQYAVKHHLLSVPVD